MALLVHSQERQLQMSKGCDSRVHCGCTAGHSLLAHKQKVCRAGVCESLLWAPSLLEVLRLTATTPGLLPYAGLGRAAVPLNTPRCGLGLKTGTLTELLSYK